MRRLQLHSDGDIACRRDAASQYCACGDGSKNDLSAADSSRLIFGVQKIDQCVPHDEGAIEHILHADILVWLMGQLQKPRAVGDAILQFANTINVFLVVSSGTYDVFCILSSKMSVTSARTSDSVSSMR